MTAPHPSVTTPLAFKPASSAAPAAEHAIAHAAGDTPGVAATAAPPRVSLRGVGKRFTLHQQHGVELAVFDGVDLDVFPGECVVLDGPSGMGKSTLLKLIYGNYRASSGHIWVRPEGAEPLDVAHAAPQAVLALRRHTMGYVSQFLRTIPRVAALDVVAEPLRARGFGADEARDQARQWLTRLGIPERLWALPPATFSGGEQQRINIARSLIAPWPLLLLDEPTASLDAANTRTVVALIHEARQRGAAVLGIFHDQAVAQAVATRRVAVAALGRHVSTDAPTPLGEPV